MPSFDVVSNVDLQEVDNALNQARKEIVTRYDFRDSKSQIEFDKDKGVITLIADDKMKLEALTQIINQKMSKRGVSPKSLEYKPAEQASGDTLRQIVNVKQGITTDEAKGLVKLIKEENLKKIQASIQGEQVRVTGPKRDDLQTVIQLLKTKATNLDLQFVNFRE